MLNGTRTEQPLVSVGKGSIVGGLLELLGLALVAWDVWDSHRSIRGMTPQKVKELHGGLMPNAYTTAVAIAKVNAGHIRRRAIGVGLFAAGVIVQTVGNIWSVW